VKEPMIVASARDQGPRRSEDSTRVWLVLGWIGLVFLTVGGADFALTWFPPSFGTPEWEFATVTQSFNGLPILLLGVGLLTAAAEQVDRRWWAHLGSGAALVLLLWVLAGFVLWALNIPLALQTVPDELALGLQKAVGKTLLQSLVYPAVLVYLLRGAWLVAKSRAAKPREV
jgi:hypothetical protein